MCVPYYRHDKFLKQFGNNLRELRIQKGLTQEDLAFEAELDLTQIGRIERGVTNTSISIAYKLAKALKVNIKLLFENY